MTDFTEQKNELTQTGAIFFSGQYGSTAQYAEWISESTGLPVFAVNETNADPANYDFLVLGSSVIVHKLLIRKWVKRHLADIEQKPVILFTVSGAPAGPKLDEWIAASLPEHLISRARHVALRGKLDHNGQTLALGPRSKGLAFTAPIQNLRTLSVDETIEVEPLTVTGIKTSHGSLVLRVGPFSRTVVPGPEERIGWGAIGFHIQFNGTSIVNLGDTLLHEKDWANIPSPDILMVPIGGKDVRNTMDEIEAAKATEIIRPRIVIPCHYNCPGLFSKRLNPGDEQFFKKEVERPGTSCIILGAGESVNV